MGLIEFIEVYGVKPNKRKEHNKHNNAFTFIEILITLALIAICFLPLTRMFSTALEQTCVISNLTVARYLAQEGMEKIKNLNFTESQLKDLGDVWEPPLDKPPLLLNENKWRVLRKIIKESNPLEIHIQVYQEESVKTKEGGPIVEVVTLVEDLE